MVFKTEFIAGAVNVSERLVYHAAKVIHEGTEQDIQDIMSGIKKVRAVSDEFKQQSETLLAPMDPMEVQINVLSEKILLAARSLRMNMDSLFDMTKWSNDYKKLYRELRSGIFDE